MRGGFEIQVDDAATRVVACGELDLSAVPDLRAAVRRVVRDGRAVVDLERTTFMDSSAAEVLIELLEAGAIPILRHPAPNVNRVLELLGLGPYVLARR